MKRVIVQELPQATRFATLDEDESHHLRQVLKQQTGAWIETLDLRGRACTGRLEWRGKIGTIHWVQGQSVERRSAPLEVLPVDLEIAALKGDSMEWVIEKAVELGARSVFPIFTAHTVVQAGRKSPEELQGRWQKIADQSLKQCGRLTQLIVHNPLPIAEHLRRTSEQQSLRILADEQHALSTETLKKSIQTLTGSPSADCSVMIGPEGGWSETERTLLQNERKSVSLGPLILRAETAAIYALSVVGSVLRA
jgi:16S rRNA (uracil1498-N3)-methyltransferase